VRARRAARRARVARPENLKLTSMMDILVVLLLFLLKSFVVEGEIVTPPPDVKLPESTADAPPEATLVVAISDEVITLGGKPITSVAAALAADGLLIEELEVGLDHELGQMEDLAVRKASGSLPHKVTIQGDRDLEFRLLQKVMYTCGQAGLDEMALAVVQKARS